MLSSIRLGLTCKYLKVWILDLFEEKLIYTYVIFPLESINSLSFINDAYLQHPQWPNKNQLSMRDDPGILCLAQWANSAVQVLSFVQQAGGNPEPIVSSDTSTAAGGLFEAELVVSSRDTLSSQDYEILGLDQALPRLAMIVGQERVVYSGEIRLPADEQEEDNPCKVTCYRFGSRILFTLSGNKSNRLYYCFAQCEQVEKLLQPNFTEMDKFTVKYAPKTMEELYQQLCGLLHFRR